MVASCTLTTRIALGFNVHPTTRLRTKYDYTTISGYARRHYTTHLCTLLVLSQCGEWSQFLPPSYLPASLNLRVPEFVHTTRSRWQPRFDSNRLDPGASQALACLLGHDTQAASPRPPRTADSPRLPSGTVETLYQSQGCALRPSSDSRNMTSDGRLRSRNFCAYSCLMFEIAPRSPPDQETSSRLDRHRLAPPFGLKAALHTAHCTAALRCRTSQACVLTMRDLLELLKHHGRRVDLYRLLETLTSTSPRARMGNPPRSFVRSCHAARSKPTAYRTRPTTRGRRTR